MDATWPGGLEDCITIELAEITVAKDFTIREFKDLACINHGVIKAIAGNRY